MRQIVIVNALGEPLCFRHAVIFATQCDEDATVMSEASSVLRYACVACHREFPGHDSCVWHGSKGLDPEATYIRCRPEAGSYVARDLPEHSAMHKPLIHDGFIRPKGENTR